MGNEIEDARGVLDWRLLPDKGAGIVDHETTVRQPLVEKLSVDERDYSVVGAVDDHDPGP